MSKLQTLAQFWQVFNLTQVQQNLDEIATQITSRQDESECSRKVLIELIRDFKRDNPEDVRSAVGPLVKSFQNEIDALSRRSKSAEKAFFDIYKQLVDVADPTPILEQTIERLQKQSSKLQDDEIEIQQLRETLGDYNVQMQELKAKEKRLSELQNMVAQYDRNIDETLNERLKEAKDKMQADFDDRVKLVQEEKDLLARRLADQEGKMKSTQRQLESVQSELFELTNKATEKAEAKSEEVELLLNDLEASQHRAAVAEKEVEALKEQITALQDPVSRSCSESGDVHLVDGAHLDDLKVQLSLKDVEVAKLLSDFQTIKMEKEAEVEAVKRSLDEALTEKSDLDKKVQSLNLKLESQADYASVKKDLSILRSLEFSSMEGGQEDESYDNKPLEVMILERSKLLQGDNTSLRLERDRLTSELDRVKHELSEKTTLTDRQASLIIELEEHVEKLQQMTAAIDRGEAEGRSSTDFLVTELDLGGDSPIRSISPLQSPDLMQKSFSEASSLLPIVQAQRERFRKRNEELEDEQSRLSSQLLALQSEVSDLQADNVKLYEKIRFLQGFQSSGRGDSVSVPIESKYKQQYEKKLDPFANFSHQERQRKYSQLNIAEKVILSMVQFMLSNKFARIFVFVYALILHGLVFVVLMSQALSDSYRRDLASVEWQQRYLDHMNEEHPHH